MWWLKRKMFPIIEFCFPITGHVHISIFIVCYLFYHDIFKAFWNPSVCEMPYVNKWPYSLSSVHVSIDYTVICLDIFGFLMVSTDVDLVINEGKCSFSASFFSAADFWQPESRPTGIMDGLCQKTCWQLPWKVSQTQTSPGKPRINILLQ